MVMIEVGDGIIVGALPPEPSTHSPQFVQGHEGDRSLILLTSAIFRLLDLPESHSLSFDPHFLAAAPSPLLRCAFLLSP